MRPRLVACLLMAGLLAAGAAAAEVTRVEVLRRDDYGSHQRVIARVHFAVDPAAPASAAIADVALAPAGADGRVAFTSDLLMFVPKDADRARGTVFLEIVNRGRDQALGLLSGAAQTDLAPAAWNLGDGFLLTQGYTVAFLGWQFDVAPGQGLAFDAPVAPVRGPVRADYIETSPTPRYSGYRVAYCARDPGQADATLSFRPAMDAPRQIVPRDQWRFAEDGCVVVLPAGFARGLYEAVYEAEGSPVAGLGMAAVRDFASYLKHGAEGGPLREDPALTRRVIGFGYSQSARFLRAFLRDGFNADEAGRPAFDGLFIASAGAGGGSFNHRFAMPGQAGNSVLSVLRPVDLPPFTDDGLLARARADGVLPRVFTTVTSTEYWARAASLTHTTPDAAADAPLDPSARLYFLAGAPHAAGPLPPIQRTAGQAFRYPVNFTDQRWVLRALLEDLDAWVTDGAEPPPSRYPTLAGGTLVPLADLAFPAAPGPDLAPPPYLPPVWRMDYGPAFATAGVIANEPPVLGAEFPVLVPQVDADGNDLGGIRSIEAAVPLGTYTGWNVDLPALTALRHLAGLLGAFVPFAPTEAARQADGDPRASIAARYADRDDYLAKAQAAVDDMVARRFVLAADAPEILSYAGDLWDALVGR